MSTVPMHPEAVPGDSALLRWVIPAGTFSFAGVPAAVPSALAGLYAAGVLTGAPVVEPVAVLLRIAPGRSWRAEGAQVRQALAAALGEPAGWQPPARSGGPDALLRAAAEEVLAGEVGQYVRGHGGWIEVVAAAGDEVSIRLHGACAGCAVSGHTVQGRFETALRRRCPGLARVRTEPEPSSRRMRIPFTRNAKPAQ